MKHRLTPIVLTFTILVITSVNSAGGKPMTLRDSLLAKLAIEKNDTVKLHLYSNLIEMELYGDLQVGLGYEKPAMQLAKKLNWKPAEALIKSAIGRIYWRLGEFDKAIKYHFESLEIFSSAGMESQSGQLLLYLGQDFADGGKYAQAKIFLSRAVSKYQSLDDKYNISLVYGILSWVYANEGNYMESARCNYAALKIFEEFGDKYGIAICISNIAGDNFKLGNYDEALKGYYKAIQVTKESGDIANTAYSYIEIGNIYKAMGEFSKALNTYKIALKMGSDLDDKNIIANSYIGIAKVYQFKANYIEALRIYVLAEDELRKVSNQQTLASVYIEMGTCNTRLQNNGEAKKYFDLGLDLSKKLKSNVSFSDYYRGKEVLDSATGNWMDAYKNYKRYIIMRDSTYNKDNLMKMLSLQVQYAADKKEAAAKAEREKKEIRQRLLRNSIAGTLAGSLIFLVVVYRQRNKILKARNRSDELLLNILPEEVAEELKIKGKTEARMFDEVTVMFTDFKGFTNISEKLLPSELVSEIDTCFRAFDQIITKYNIEKIKTIGDAYMCAGGLPVMNKTHAWDVVMAALEIQKFMISHFQERQKEGKENFEIRIGIHTGPVVAGIVGIKKFAYDIWGDTVNIASRMESSGEAGKINISGKTYELVKDKFDCKYRGKIQAKNKGEVDMYFVHGLL